jgi:hypothetical protein
MDLQPPAGSTIRVATDGGIPTVVIPPTSSMMRYPTGLFLLFWLGFWFFGFKSTATQIWSGTFQPFLIFWLGAWTLGGIFAAYTAYRTFRPAVPETLALNRNSFAYDSGLAPPDFTRAQRNRTPWGNWKSMFPKRIRIELDRTQLASLRLRETDGGNRLTFDLGSERIDIAPTATEVDREWLANLLARRYALPQIMAKTADAGR